MSLLVSWHFVWQDGGKSGLPSPLSLFLLHLFFFVFRFCDSWEMLDGDGIGVGEVGAVLGGGSKKREKLQQCCCVLGGVASPLIWSVLLTGAGW